VQSPPEHSQLQFLKVNGPGILDPFGELVSGIGRLQTCYLSLFASQEVKFKICRLTRWVELNVKTANLAHTGA
jgi:hypothetical protein